MSGFNNWTMLVKGWILFQIGSIYCIKVFAADVSPTMLQFTIQKARDRDVGNVEFQEGGFLTYANVGEPLNLIVSQLALPHLPDSWKLIALKRMYSLLKNCGQFYLRDVVYSY